MDINKLTAHLFPPLTVKAGDTLEYDEAEVIAAVTAGENLTWRRIATHRILIERISGPVQATANTPTAPPTADPHSAMTGTFTPPPETHEID